MVRRGRRGVSPVIATILMIALTVILAASIIIFVGRVGLVSNPPVCSLSADKGQEPRTLFVNHMGGADLTTAELQVTMGGVDVDAIWKDPLGNPLPELTAGHIAKVELAMTITEGDDVVITHKPSKTAICTDTITSITPIGAATYTLSASADPPGSGMVSPSSGTYNEGDSVTLTAYPGAGYEFYYWSGDAAGTSTTTTITMNSDKSVTANFTVVGVTSTTTTISPSLFSIESGTTQVLTATVSPLGATGTITWSATAGSCSPTTGASTTYTAPTVATETPVTVTASFAGTGVYGSSQGTSAGTITPPGITTTTTIITPATFSIESGTTQALTAAVNPSAALGTITWSATAGSCSPGTGTSTTYTAPTVATETPVTVTATLSPTAGYGSSQGTSAGTITPPGITTTTTIITPATFSIESGTTQALTAAVNPSAALGTITWSATAGSCSPTTGASTTYTAPTVATETPVTVTASFAGTGVYGSSQGTSAGTITPVAVEWPLIPGTYPITIQAGTNLHNLMVTHHGSFLIVSEGDLGPTEVTIDMAGKISYDMVLGSISGGISDITIPASSFSCDPFYITTQSVSFVTVHMWGDLRMETDGTGQLATEAGKLDVDVSTVVRSTEADPGAVAAPLNFEVVTSTGDGTMDPAGSALVEMTLFLDVYAGESETDPGAMSSDELLMSLPIPMKLTTGNFTLSIDDPTPYTAGSVNLDGEVMTATGTPANSQTGAVTLVGGTGGLDIYAYLMGMLDSWTDFMAVATMVQPPVA